MSTGLDEEAVLILFLIHEVSQLPHCAAPIPDDAHTQWHPHRTLRRTYTATHMHSDTHTNTPPHVDTQTHTPSITHTLTVTHTHTHTFTQPTRTYPHIMHM